MRFRSVTDKISELIRKEKYVIIKFPKYDRIDRFSINNKNIELIIEYINNFEEILKENVKHYDLNTFYNNLKTLNVTSNISDFEHIIGTTTNFVSGYDTKTNTIIINNDKEIKKYIYHELFHVSTTKTKNEKYITGFDQVSDNKEFGMGLNEIYTDILTNRYFESLDSGYAIISHLVEPFETLIGKEKMEEMYSKSDLLQLINEANKYIDADDIIKYIDNLDTMVCDIQDDKLNYRKLIKLEKEQNEILLKGIMNKYCVTNNKKDFYESIDNIQTELCFSSGKRKSILKRKSKTLIRTYGYNI